MYPVYSARTRYNKRTSQHYVLTDGEVIYLIGHKTDIQKLAKAWNKEDKQNYGKNARRFKAVKCKEV